ncbi:MAG: nitrogenase molybdenum-iron protein alpha and beta [Geobacteraceae bacterium]|nr:MAG: nitrogenase molybdenum-iron protein alpha and beta [Geobacteraceae bacterium]
MSLLKGKASKTREKRLNTLSAYMGDIHPLVEGFRKETVSQRIRTFSQSTFDEVIYVLRLLNRIADAVTIIHSPRGCAAAQLYLHATEREGEDGRWAVTNLNERDTIMGSDAKLRETVVSLYRRYRPRLIFIVATPAVAINNDDIQSVVEELREELDVRIVPVYSDGFKSKNAVTGYDVALHALVKYLIVKEQKVRGNYVNLLSVTENASDLETVEGLLKELGLRANILPNRAAPENFVKAAQAKQSISINPDYSDYLGKALESDYGVPFVQPPLPIGINGTYRWLSAIGEATGLKDAVDDLHARESGAVLRLREKAALQGVRVYVNLPAATALGVAAMVEELGGEVAGVTIEHVDSLHEGELAALLARKPGLQIHVAQGQPFEEANILQRTRPDLYVGGLGQQVVAAKLGIPAVSINNTGILGYRGVARFVHLAVKALKNRAFILNLAKNSGLPYADGWRQKSPYWYIKQEVK